MSNSMNGWPVLDPNETKKWTLSLEAGSARHLVLAPGPAGFVLVHFADWFDAKIEPLNQEKQWDDWGYAVRNVRGSTTAISNHSSGTAMDLNAVQHGRGVHGTFTKEQVAKIDRKLRTTYRSVIRWGEHYSTTVDGMHFEIDAGFDLVKALRDELRQTKRGETIAAVNNEKG